MSASSNLTKIYLSADEQQVPLNTIGHNGHHDIPSSDFSSGPFAVKLFEGGEMTADVDSLTQQARAKQKLSPRVFMWFITFFAALSGFLFGYDIGVVAGALPKLKETFNADETQKEIVVSILLVGSIVGYACPEASSLGFSPNPPLSNRG